MSTTRCDPLQVKEKTKTKNKGARNNTNLKAFSLHPADPGSNPSIECSFPTRNHSSTEPGRAPGRHLEAASSKHTRRQTGLDGVKIRGTSWTPPHSLCASWDHKVSCLEERETQASSQEVQSIPWRLSHPWITRKATESRYIFCSVPADTGTVDNVSRGAPQLGPKASLTPKPRVSACALQYLVAEQL